MSCRIRTVYRFCPVPHLGWKNQAVSTELGLNNSMTLTCLLLTKSVRREHYADVLNPSTLEAGLRRNAIQDVCTAIQTQRLDNTDTARCGGDTAIHSTLGMVLYFQTNSKLFKNEYKKRNPNRGYKYEKEKHS